MVGDVVPIRLGAGGPVIGEAVVHTDGTMSGILYDSDFARDMLQTSIKGISLAEPHEDEGPSTLEDVLGPSSALFDAGRTSEY